VVGDPAPSWTSTLPPAFPFKIFTISEQEAHRGAVRRCIGLLAGIAGVTGQEGCGWDTKKIPRAIQVHMCGAPGVVLVNPGFFVLSSVVIVGGRKLLGARANCARFSC